MGKATARPALTIRSHPPDDRDRVEEKAKTAQSTMTMSNSVMPIVGELSTFDPSLTAANELVVRRALEAENGGAGLRVGLRKPQSGSSLRRSDGSCVDCCERAYSSFVPSPGR